MTCGHLMAETTSSRSFSSPISFDNHPSPPYASPIQVHSVLYPLDQTLILLKTVTMPAGGRDHPILVVYIHSSPASSIRLFNVAHHPTEAFD
jgi:hypothetical protein